MAPIRSSVRKQGLCTTKPGSLLKQHVHISTDQWDIAHCGTSAEGMFVFTVNCIDLATSWREQRAVWGKGERAALLALQDIERSLPFPLLGFDCAHGSEFLNWSILKYFRKLPVQYTRSRPYHKNDNAHIEEKNWMLVRQYLGYQRSAQPCLADQQRTLSISMEAPNELLYPFYQTHPQKNVVALKLSKSMIRLRLPSNVL